MVEGQSGCSADVKPTWFEKAASIHKISMVFSPVCTLVEKQSGADVGLGEEWPGEICEFFMVLSAAPACWQVGRGGLAGSTADRGPAC